MSHWWTCFILIFDSQPRVTICPQFIGLIPLTFGHWPRPYPFFLSLITISILDVAIFADTYPLSLAFLILHSWFHGQTGLVPLLSCSTAHPLEKRDTAFYISAFLSSSFSLFSRSLVTSSPPLLFFFLLFLLGQFFASSARSRVPASALRFP